MAIAKQYTAQEMRDVAKSIEANVVMGPITDMDDLLIRAMNMLRQAADETEREEREKKYEYTAEYVKRRSGKVGGKCVYHFNSFDRAKRFDYYPLKNEKLRFLRRSVGEWEEVK